MKPDRTVLRETMRVGLGVLAMTAVMLVVFAVLDRFSISALLGAVYTAILGVLNFFVMGLTVQNIANRAAEKKRDEDELAAFSKQMEARMKLSRNMRLIALVGLIALGIAVFKFEPLPTILPIVFPSIVIRILQIIEIRKSPQEKGSEEP